MHDSSEKTSSYRFKLPPLKIKQALKDSITHQPKKMLIVLWRLCHLKYELNQLIWFMVRCQTSTLNESHIRRRKHSITRLIKIAKICCCLLFIKERAFQGLERAIFWSRLITSNKVIISPFFDERIVNFYSIRDGEKFHHNNSKLFLYISWIKLFGEAMFAINFFFLGLLLQNCSANNWEKDYI